MLKHVKWLYGFENCPDFQYQITECLTLIFNMSAMLTTLILLIASFLWGNAQIYTLEDKWVDCGNNISNKSGAIPPAQRSITVHTVIQELTFIGIAIFIFAETFAFKDYYISGELQSEQYPIFIDYSDEGKTFLEGTQKFYHKNGKIAGVKYYFNNLWPIFGEYVDFVSVRRSTGCPSWI